MGEAFSSVRLVRLIAALLVAFSLVAAYGAANASAADRDFAARFSTNDTGDIEIYGNTLMTCPDSAACTSARNATPLTSGTDTTQTNNGYNMRYINTAGGTFNSSSSTVSLPAGSQVLFAGLYWGGRTPAGTGGSAAPNAAARNVVKFKAPGASAYTSLTASTLDDSTTTNLYQGFVDVTSRVQAAGNGTYSVADVQSGTGADGLAGWSLVVAYRDTTMPARNLTVFDGLKGINGSQSGTINVSGFKTPPAGDVNTTVGFVTYEGDSGIAGDAATLNGTTLSDAQHPATNFFDSRSSRDGVLRSNKDPNYANNLGYEASMLSVGKPIVKNNDTSATIGLTTSGDVYAPGVVTFATDLYAPKIDQTKTVTDDNGGDVEQGDTLTYTISGKNSGQDGAANFVLRDPLPANTAYVPGSLKVTQPGGSATAVTDGADTDTGEYDAANRRVVTRLGTGANGTVGGTIAPGASYAATFKVKVGGPAPSVASGTVLSNTATASFNSQSLGTALTAASNATSTVKSPDLTIVKKRSGDLVRGRQGTYLIDVKNSGDAKTQGEVTVQDALPAGLTATAAAGDGWTCSVTSGDVTCKRSDALAAGSSYPTITVTVNVTDDVPNSVANSATVSGGGDGDLGNNSSTDTSVASSSADLALEKTRDTASPAVGGNVAYTLKVTNNGDSRSTGSVVTDTLPAGLTYVSSDAACAGSAGASSVTCTVGALAKGASASFSVTAKPATGTAGTSLKNTAKVSGNEPDPTSGNDTASSSVDVKPVDLAVTNAIDGNPDSLTAGQTYTWNIGVKNNGGSPAAGSTLAFPVPAGTSVVTADLDPRCTVSSDGKTVSCALGTIAPGAAVATIKIPLKVADGAAAPANVSTIATAKSLEQDANVADNSAQTSTPVKSAVDLGVALKADPGSASAGDTLKLTATVTNNGPASPSAPKLVVPIPKGTTFVSAPTGCTYDAANDRVVCDLPAGDLGPGKSIDRTIVVKVGDTPGDSIDASATVSSASSDTDPSNDTASLAVPVVKVAGLSITKTASTTQAKPGDVVTYTLKATNDGPAGARDTVVTDTLPAGTTFVSADAPCTNAGGKVTCDLGTVAAGDSRTVEIKVKVAAIDSSLDPRATHQIEVTKVESNLAIPASSSGTATATCPSGSVATDGSVRLDAVDQGAGTFSDARIASSGATADGTGWTGKVVNRTTGQLQAKVNVVCVSRQTTSDGGHSHPLLISDPVTTTRDWTAGTYDVALSCGTGRVAIAPSFAFDGDATVRASRRSGAGWAFTVDVPEATKATFGIRCLSTSVGVAAGHTHDLDLSQVSDTLTIPAGGTAEKQLSCGDGKGIVGSVDLDKGLVSLGSDPRPVIRDFRIYNPTSGTLTARLGLLCLGTHTGGELAVKDVVNTANVTTTTPDAKTTDDSSSATFRATAASGSTAPTPTPAPAAPAAPSGAAPSPAATSSSGSSASPAASSSSAGSSGASVSPRVAILAVARKALRVAGTAAKPVVPVSLTCAKGAACDGRVQLVASSKVRGTKLKRGAVLASAPVAIAAGRKATVRLKAKKPAARALRTGKVKKAKLVVRADGAKKVTRTVTLRRR